MRIFPFEAIRPATGAETIVAALPYDVMDTREARAMAEGNPDSFLRVTRPELELEDGADAYADAVYQRAADNLQGLRERGALMREQTPQIYLYRQTATLLGQERTQTGIVCCCHIDDYLNDIIKKHENTRQVKEDDRTRHVLETNCNAGPVFLMYPDRDAVDVLVERDCATAPLYDFTSEDGVRHTVWIATDAAAYEHAFASMEAAYVADGHHRSASAARAGAERRSTNPGHTGDEEYNRFLTVLFPASQLTILPYHRVVADLNGMSPGAFIEKLGEVGTVRELPAGDHVPEQTGSFCVFVDGRWLELTLDSIDHADPVASLDYQLLSDRVLGPLLGITDIRTDGRIDFVGGIRGPGELRRRVTEGRAAVGFAMAPVTIEQLLAVADAGRIMPPKSTWFEPKLRSGLLVHELD
ncbi:MAG: DUF1015 family protein [Planctomycetota bacterium]